MTQTSETIGTVRSVDIINEMQIAYLDYAMSVIVARALPDVRDGLKPVHRRILYAMADLGLTNDKPYKKSARIVGEVLGKYHPHGDTAVYDAMVRMAQDFSLRYPLVDGQGNFGSVDGDNAAAMRYTEARLAKISDLILADLDKDTVEWTDNFDNTLKEPEILPAALPNLLINGASGIAVGMSTNIPPHNLGEVVDALVYLLDNHERMDDVGVEDLMHFIKGPDFPTGGIVFRYRTDSRGVETTDAITQGYSTGRGRLVVQAKAHFEEMSRGRTRIVVTELPYQTNKTNLLERIAMLVRDGKLEGITDLRDESDRTGMRIMIELTRNVDPRVVLEDLFKYTPMQQTFGMSMLALVDGEPRTLALKRMLQLFIEHRQVVIRRRSEYDLARARERAHIVEGLLRALDILDEVIDTIRRSQRVDTARTNLMSNFGFTEVQAQAILDMPLKRLAALERKRLQDEYQELLDRIAYLEDLLAHPEKILRVIREELSAIRLQYADARRTQIVERTKGTLTATDLLPDQKVLVTVGASGEVRRQDFSLATKTGLRQSGRDSAVALLVANTQDFLYLFDKKGQCQRISIHELPQEESKHLADLTDYSRRDTIVAALALPRLTTDAAAGYLFAATRLGTVKRVSLADFIAAASTNPEIIRVEGRDELGWVFVTPGNQEVILVSSDGYSIRFSEEDVRSMGLPAAGVAGMKLKKGEKLVAAGLVDPEGELLTATAAGYAKRTPLRDYSSQGRNGSGIIAHKLDQRTNKLIDALVVNSERRDLVIFVADKGGAKPYEVSEIAASGRGTLGQNLLNVSRGDRPVAVKRVEGVPGFVGDDTLAPPPASGNGRPSRAQTKVAADVVETPVPAAENGRADRREVRPLRRQAAKPAAETPVPTTAKPVSEPKAEPAAKVPVKPAAKAKAETSVADGVGRTKASGTGKAESVPRNRKTSIDESAAAEGAKQEPSPTTSKAESASRTRKAARMESNATEDARAVKSPTEPDGAGKPERARRTRKAARVEIPVEPGAEAKPAAASEDKVATGRRMRKVEAQVESAVKVKPAVAPKEEGAARASKRRKVQTPAEDPGANGKAPAAANGKAAKPVRRAEKSTATSPEESPVQPELIPRDEAETKATAAKKTRRSTKATPKSKVERVKSVTTAPKKKK
jgi:DNA gyrase subunit A